MNPLLILGGVALVLMFLSKKDADAADREETGGRGTEGIGPKPEDPPKVEETKGRATAQWLDGKPLAVEQSEESKKTLEGRLRRAMEGQGISQQVADRFALWSAPEPEPEPNVGQAYSDEALLGHVSNTWASLINNMIANMMEDVNAASLGTVDESAFAELGITRDELSWDSLSPVVQQMILLAVAQNAQASGLLNVSAVSYPLYNFIDTLAPDNAVGNYARRAVNSAARDVRRYRGETA